MSLQLVAGVSSDEEVWAGSCTVADGCLSGLFLVGEAWLVALGGGGVLFWSGASECGAKSVSGCTTGGRVDVLAHSMLVNSTGCWLAGGLGGASWDLSGVKAGGGEFLPLPLSGVEAWTGGRVVWRTAEASRGDGGVEASQA